MHGPEKGEEPTVTYQDDPIERVTELHTAITLHHKYLETPLVIHKELNLHQYAAQFSNYYQDLAKFSATPYPFPTAQMTRIFLFVWMFSLPFALLHDVSEPYSIILIIFFITYGFFGLEFVSIELDDPFGDDPNDLEMRALSSVVIRGVREDLETVSKTSTATQSSYESSEAHIN